MKSKSNYTLLELTQGLEVEIKGDPQCLISGVSPIEKAESGHVTFLTHSLYRKYLETTQAAAVILGKKDVESCSLNAIVCQNPHYIYSKIASYFTNDLPVQTGIHPSVVVGRNCEIDDTACIGAHCVIGNNVKIAARAVIGAGCIVSDEVNIGEATQVDPRVMIYHHVNIGKRVRIASGVVIGSEGFGFANQKGTWHKVPQLGGVDIEDDVDIGANTTIDRGAIQNTVVESGVKLDNLIQIGHNVKIGANTIIAGCVAIAGSVVIGKNCMIGGATCFAGHITICDNAAITGMSAVTKSITTPGLYSSGIVGVVPNHEFRKNNARFHRLDNLMQRVKSLESTLKKMTERE